jgi:transglutaminase-like putative cysteine protease
MIQMDYRLELQYQAQGRSDFVFNICPARTRAQRVLKESFAVDGATTSHTFTEPSTANRINRLYTEGGLVTIRYQSTVEIDHLLVDPMSVDECAISCVPPEVLPYVLPSRYCQSDKMRSTALAMFGHVLPGYARVSSICDWVTQHVRFKPGASDATTCAMETFNSRVGVCRDYAHLMISICRALNIPARYVTSVDFGADPSLGPTDFHACVEVFMGKDWYLFDPSGLSKIMGLIRIGTGRDAADASFATVFGNVRCLRPNVSIELLSDNITEGYATTSAQHAISTATSSLSAQTVPAVIISYRSSTAEMPGFLAGLQTPAGNRVPQACR